MEPKIKNLLNQIATGQIKTNEAKILNFIIENKGAHINGMRFGLNMQHQTLTARLSVLEDFGILYKSGTINNGNHSVWSYEPDEKKQAENSMKRQRQLFNIWRKQGILKYDKFMNAEMIEFLK